MTVAQPACVAIRAACTFVAIPPLPMSDLCFACHAQYLFRNRRYLGNVFGAFILGCRVARIQPIDIGQQDQCIGHDELGDTRSEAIIVTVADLFRSDRVVFVDHRHDGAIDQATERTAGIQEATPILGVFRSEQDLRRRYVVCIASASR